MKDSITGLELHYLLKELQFLVGSRLDTIYQPGEKEFIFQFYAGNKGKQLLKFNGKYLILLSEKGEMPEQPSGFCQNLRKYLEGSKLRDLSQKGFERVMQMEFETKSGSYLLILELFAGGNLALCTQDKRIVALLTKLEVKDRTLKTGASYVLPKKMLDISATEEELKEFFSKQDRDLVRYIASGLGIGGIFAEEVCFVTGIDKNSRSVSDRDIPRIHSALQALLTKPLEPILVYENNQLIDALPFRIGFYESKRIEKAPSFSAALEQAFAKSVKVKQKKPNRYESEIKKLQSIIQMQTMQQEDAQKHAAELQKVGELIYHNYQEFKDVLEKAKAKRPDKRIKKTYGTKAAVEL